MERNITALKSVHFDILVIGGGITGATIAFDAALRGYRVALIEKHDFGWATSMATSKMLHGGLRYLAQFDIEVVKESLVERHRLTELAPHQAFPLPFLFPIYKDTPTPKWMLQIGLTLYDFLHLSAPTPKDKSKYFPKYVWHNKEKTLELEPNLDPNNLKGSFVYYDAQNLHPERMNIDFVKSAVAYGAVVANYVQAEDFLTNNYNNKNTVTGVQAVDLITNESFKIVSKTCINAAGPWGFEILNKLYPIEKSNRTLIKSKGIHLIFPKKQGDYALTFNTRDDKHFFVLPWLNYTLIGTTDSVFDDSPDNVYITEEEVVKLINLVNEYYPVQFSYDELLHAYAGIRPLVAKGNTKNSYNVSRKHEILDHDVEHNIENIVSVFGGKYTTSRALAEDTVNFLQNKYKLGSVPCKTKKTTLKSGNFKIFYSDYIKKECMVLENIYPIELIKHLIEYYGTDYKEILRYVEDNKNLLEPIDKSNIRIKAEINYAIDHELAYTLSDFLYRRCGWGNEGLKDKRILKNIATYMGKFFDWTKEDITEQITNYLEKQDIVSN